MSTKGPSRGGLPTTRSGERPPARRVAGPTPTNANPTGLSRLGELRMVAPLARLFSVYALNRQPGLDAATTGAQPHP